MLFYVKIQLKMDKMGEMLEKTALGEIPNPADHSTIYCSDTVPGLGYSIFDVKSKEQLDDMLKKLEPFSQVYETASVMTLAEFQAKMAGGAQ